MINFLIGWINIGLFTWLFVIMLISLIGIVASFGKNIGWKTVRVHVRRFMNLLTSPKSIIHSLILGPLFTIALIEIIIEVIAGE